MYIITHFILAIIGFILGGIFTVHFGVIKDITGEMITDRVLAVEMFIDGPNNYTIYDSKTGDFLGQGSTKEEALRQAENKRPNILFFFVELKS